MIQAFRKLDAMMIIAPMQLERTDKQHIAESTPHFLIIISARQVSCECQINYAFGLTRPGVNLQDWVRNWQKLSSDN